MMAGCAASQQYAKGRQSVVEASSPSKPDWSYKTTYFKKDGMLCFSGGVTDAHDYALARRQAKAAAIKNAVEGISIRARTEYTEALRGSNSETIGKYVEDAVAFTSQTVDIQGMIPGEEYMEKVETQLDDGVRYGYNLFAFYQLKESDYVEAKRRALEKLLGKARSEKDKAAEQTAKKLLDKLNASDAQ